MPEKKICKLVKIVKKFWVNKVDLEDKVVEKIKTEEENSSIKLIAGTFWI